MTGPADAGPPPGRTGEQRRRVGTLVALVPVLLFVLSIGFIVVRSPGRQPACDHDHRPERVRSWWETVRREEVAVPGTRSLTFDDSLGCIVVALDEARARPHLERRLRSLGIPLEVVVWETVDDGGGSEEGRR